MANGRFVGIPDPKYVNSDFRRGVRGTTQRVIGGPTKLPKKSNLKGQGRVYPVHVRVYHGIYCV